MTSARVDASFATRYSGSMAKETKSVRYNMWMKPSVKKKLTECAGALKLSEADTIEEALKRLHKARDVREALAGGSNEE